MILFKKVAFGVTFFTMALSFMPTNLPVLSQVAVNVVAEEIEPRADVVYWVYRELSDGTIQRRRWNETRGYWVDDHWITVGHV